MSQFDISKIFDAIPFSGMDFEYCAIKQTQTKKFTFTNPFNQVVKLDVQCNQSESSVFKVEPKTRKLPFCS